MEKQRFKGTQRFHIFICAAEPSLSLFPACALIGWRDLAASLLSLSLVVFWAGWQIYINTNTTPGEVDLLMTSVDYRWLWLEVAALLFMVFATEFLIALSWMQCKRRQYLGQTRHEVVRYLIPYLVILPTSFLLDLLAKIFGYQKLWSTSFAWISLAGFLIKYPIQWHSWWYLLQNFRGISSKTTMPTVSETNRILDQDGQPESSGNIKPLPPPSGYHPSGHVKVIGTTVPADPKHELHLQKVPSMGPQRIHKTPSMGKGVRFSSPRPSGEKETYYVNVGKEARDPEYVASTELTRVPDLPDSTSEGAEPARSPLGSFVERMTTLRKNLSNGRFSFVQSEEIDLGSTEHIPKYTKKKRRGDVSDQEDIFREQHSSTVSSVEGQQSTKFPSLSDIASTAPSTRTIQKTHYGGSTAKITITRTKSSDRLLEEDGEDSVDSGAASQTPPEPIRPRCHTNDYQSLDSIGPELDALDLTVSRTISRPDTFPPPPADLAAMSSDRGESYPRNSESTHNMFERQMQTLV